jgi:hypothetical protein
VAGVALLLVTVRLPAQDSNMVLPIPGWHLYRGNLSSATVDCVELSHAVWKVTGEGGQLHVTEPTLRNVRAYGLGWCLLRRLQLINTYVVGFLCVGNVGVSASFFFQRRYVSAALVAGLALFLY